MSIDSIINGIKLINELNLVMHGVAGELRPGHACFCLNDILYVAVQLN